MIKNLLLLFLLLFANYTPTYALVDNHLAKPTKLYGNIDIVVSSCSAAGISILSTSLPAVIERVRPGSSAFYMGIAKDDKILSADISEDKVVLTIERSGKQYSATLNTAPVTSDGQTKTTAIDGGQQSSPLHSEQASSDTITRLGNYDIAILIDCSGSMAQGLSSLPETKWQWCQHNIVSFAQRMRPYIKGDLQLVTFNDNFSIQTNCTAESIENVFCSTFPTGGTDIGTPLQNILQQHFASSNGKPLLIVVMTDGLPTEGGSVAEPIITATTEMRNPNDVRITFLEIGEEYPGRAFLKALDDSLVNNGARYDVVDTLTFDQVRSLGLINALSRAINH